MGGGALTIYLDTHAAVWYANGTALRPAAMRLLDEALPARRVFLSVISACEIGMLVTKGRLTVPSTSAEYVGALFARDGIVEDAVTAGVAERAATLPGEFPGDPADRIIVASAVEHGSTLLTRDERIVTYLRRTKATPVVPC